MTHDDVLLVVEALNSLDHAVSAGILVISMEAFAIVCTLIFVGIQAGRGK